MIDDNPGYGGARIIEVLSLVVTPIVADVDDKPLFMDSSPETYTLEDIRHQNGALWLN